MINDDDADERKAICEDELDDFKKIDVNVAKIKTWKLVLYYLCYKKNPP